MNHAERVPSRNRPIEPAGLDPVILAHEAPFDLGALHVEPALRRVARPADGRQAILEPKVMQVLVALARDPGRILSRDDLVAMCWDGLVVGDDAVHRVISQLRKRLADIADGSVAIETITKVGYQLALADTQAGTDARPSSPSSAERAVRRRPPALLLVALLAAAIAAFAVWQARDRADPAAAARPAAALTILPVAVAAEADRPLARGFETSLVTILNSTGRIEVSGMESAAMLADRDVAPAAIARRLDKDFVLEIVLARDGRVLEAQVRQVAADGTLAFARVYRRPENSLELLLNDVVGAIARHALPAGSDADRGRARAADALAGADETLFLTAVGLAESGDYEDYQTAETLLRGLEGRYPDNAVVKLQLARVVNQLFFLDPDWETGVFIAPEALELARAAQRLAPDLAEAQAVEAIVRGPVAGVRPALERAAALDPYNRTILSNLAGARFASFDFVGGWRANLAAWELDPLAEPYGDDPNIPASFGWGDQADALDRFVLDHHPDRAARLVAKSRMAQRAGDTSEALRLRIEAMPESEGDDINTNRNIVYRMGLALGISPGPFGNPLMRVADAVWEEQLPDAATLEAAGAWSHDFLNSWIFSRLVFKQMANAHRSDELRALYDRYFESPAAMRRAMIETYQGSLVKFVSMAPYAAIALRDGGRDEEADTLLRLALADIDKARADGPIPYWIDVEFARLEATAGRREAAARHLRRAIEGRWFTPFIQHQYYGGSLAREDRAFETLWGSRVIADFDAQLDEWRTRERAEAEPILRRYFASDPVYRARTSSQSS